MYMFQQRWSEIKVSYTYIVFMNSLGHKIKSKILDFLVGLCTC